MIEIDTDGLSHQAANGLLSSLVVPRPIAWVSTLGSDGIANLAPHSFFNVVSTAPPVVMFSSGHTSRHNPEGRKDTVRNIEATGEFVVNFVSDDLLEAMNATSAEVPASVDEFTLAGLAKAPSRHIKPPRVATAKAALECRLRQILPMAGHSIVFGDVVAIILHEDVYVGERVDPARLRPVGRLGGTLYTELGNIRSVKRPGADAPKDKVP
jgi:flavin reductase (DIM6/NTAB) family NADH-FMN oxidoreductase RutF